MNTNNKCTDMLNGTLYNKIFLFALPIALSSMLQQLFNAADTSIVGFFDTTSSLAAVGTNSEIIALIVSISAGISIGANVLIARQIGMKTTKNITSIIQNALVLALAIGLLVFIAGQFIATPLLILIKTPTDVLTSAALYLKIYFCSYPFLMIFDFGSAILRAGGDSRYPFIALTFSGIVNILLNMLFVILFHIGVAGVALATVISTILSALLILLRLWKDSSVFHLTFKCFKIKSEYIADILKIGIPSAIQSAVFCFANIFVQASINCFGASAIAGNTIAINFEYFAYYIITAFGQTATTFVSQNYAANQKKRCYKVLWLCIILSVICSMIIIGPIIIFRYNFTGLFTTQSNVIQSACTRIMYILLFEPICSLYEIPAGVLRGSEHSLYPAFGTIIGTCLFRILWIIFIFNKYKLLTTLYIAFPLSWILTTLLIIAGFIIIKPLK